MYEKKGEWFMKTAVEGGVKQKEELLMQAAVVSEFNKELSLQSVPKPKPGPGQALVKIQACGVCHTDLHAAQGDWPVKPKLPLIPGHEGVGIVEEIGEGVTAVKVGDRVGIPWLYSACGECDYCLNGQETLCHDQENGGYSVDGAYAEYCLAAADYVAKIPESLSSVDAAPILCAGVTTYKALKVSGAKPGDWVAIYGIGGLGHVALQYAKAMGFNVVAVDIADEKLELAKELGADETINGLKEDPAEAIQSRVGGVQAAISVAVTKIAFEQAYRSVKRGGTLVVVGLPNAELPIPIFNTVLNGVSVKGSIVGTRLDMKEALDFAARGKVKAHIETAPLSEVNNILDKMAQGKINGRIVLTF